MSDFQQYFYVIVLKNQTINQASLSTSANGSLFNILDHAGCSPTSIIFISNLISYLNNNHNSNGEHTQ